MGLIENIKKRGLKDALNPDKWSVMLEDKTLKKEGFHIPHNEMISWAEQLQYRLIVCAPCVKRGSCEHCGCDTPDAMLTPSNWCSAGHWDKYMAPEEWEKYKKENNIEFTII